MHTYIMLAQSFPPSFPSLISSLFLSLSLPPSLPPFLPPLSSPIRDSHVTVRANGGNVPCQEPLVPFLVLKGGEGGREGGGEGGGRRVERKSAVR